MKQLMDKCNQESISCGLLLASGCRLMDTETPSVTTGTGLSVSFFRDHRIYFPAIKEKLTERTVPVVTF